MRKLRGEIGFWICHLGEIWANFWDCFGVWFGFGLFEYDEYLVVFLTPYDNIHEASRFYVERKK